MSDQPADPDVDPALADVPLPGEHHRSPLQLATGLERPSLMDAMGGPVGVAESAIPSVVFIIAITAGVDIKESAIASVAVALVGAFIRLARRETIQFALAGIFGVLISAFVAYKTGDAKNYFVPSFFVNAGYASIALISVLVKHPFVGHLVDGLGGGDSKWREDPVKLRLYTWLSLLWVGLFLSRLVVQLPIYFYDDSIAALGTIKLIMGYPLFGLGIYVTWLLLRPHREAEKAARAAAEPDAPGSPPVA